MKDYDGSERRTNVVSFVDVLVDLKTDINTRFKRTDDKIDNLSKELLDPDDGAIARVKTLEPIVEDLDKIVNGNGKEGIANQIKFIKRDLSRFVKISGFILIAVTVALLNAYMGNRIDSMFKNIQSPINSSYSSEGNN